MEPGATPDAGTVDDRHDTRDLSRGAGFGVAGSLLGRGLSFLTQVLVGRGLGPAAFGAFGLGWTLFRLGALVAPLGLHLGVLRFGSASPGEGGEAPRGLLRRAAGLALLGGLASSGLLVALAPWLEARVFGIEGLAGVLVAFAAALPLVALLTVLAAGARAVRRIALAVSVEQVLQPLAFLALGAAALAAWRSPAAVAWGHFGSYALAAVAALVATRALLGTGVGGPLSRALVAYSLPTALAGVLTLAVTWTDRLFVGYLMPGEAVGVYHAASQVPMALATVLGGFNAIFGPMAADLHLRREDLRLRSLYRTATRWGVLAALPVLAVVLAVPRELLGAVFGTPYEGGAGALFWLGVGQAVNVGTGGVGFLLMMTGRERVWLRWTAMAVFLNVPLNLVLIPRWGVAGAAVATALSISLLYAGAVWSVRRLLGVWPWGREFRSIALCSLLVPGALWAAGRLGVGGTGRLLGVFAAGSIAAFVAWRWGRAREREEAFRRELRPRVGGDR